MLNIAPFGNKKLFKDLKECHDVSGVRALLGVEKVQERLKCCIKYYKLDNTYDVDKV